MHIAKESECVWTLPSASGPFMPSLVGQTATDGLVEGSQVFSAINWLVGLRRHDLRVQMMVVVVVV